MSRRHKDIAICQVLTVKEEFACGSHYNIQKNCMAVMSIVDGNRGSGFHGLYQPKESASFSICYLFRISPLPSVCSPGSRPWLAGRTSSCGWLSGG